MGKPAQIEPGGGYRILAVHVQVGQALLNRVGFGLCGIQFGLECLNFDLQGFLLRLQSCDFCLGFGVGAGGKGKSKDDGGKNFVHEKTSGQR